MKHLRKYIFFVLMCLMCLMCFEAKAVSPLQPLKLIHYDGCVNIGVPDTLLLRVENPVEGAAYRWQIPAEWKPIGCTTCAELRVETLEKTAATRIYGVSLSGAGFAMDTIQVRGADTALRILANRTRYLISSVILYQPTDSRYFDFVWYKGDCSEENKVSTSYYIHEQYFDGLTPLLKYRRKNEGCWTVTDEKLQFDSSLFVRLEHYEGCVNIGMESELLLRVKNPMEGLRYHWQIPETWEPIGDTNGSELRVITHETKDTTHIYGVGIGMGYNKLQYAFDTVQVRGADTTQFILDDSDVYCLWSGNFDVLDEDAFEFLCYKGRVHPDSMISGWIVEDKYRFNGTPPVFAYRPIGGCWTVTDHVVVFDSIDPIRLSHYDVCVNIGVPDTLLLRVENADDHIRYHWQIPDTWEPIGDTDRGELRVVTHETKDTTRIYGVRFAIEGTWSDGWNIWRYDTVQVKGADTTFYIALRQGRCSGINDGMAHVSAMTNYFDLVWYKENITEENRIASNSSWILWSQLDGQKPLLKYKSPENTCWSVTDEVVVHDSVVPIKLKHYDGCVNIGVPDTLLLRLENADARLRYRWQIPNEWEPIGDTNRGELRVITHETKDTTRIYGVKFADWGPSVFDTIQVKGADTALIILDNYDLLELSNIHADVLKEENFDCFWYKGAINRNKILYSEDHPYNRIYMPAYQFEGEKPIAQYRFKGGCWSVTDDVIPYKGIVHIEIAGKGMVRVHSGRIYVDVVSEGKHEVWAGNADTLQFVVKPFTGFYFDRIEIEDNEQVTVVPEEAIERDTDGTFSFHNAVTWQKNERTSDDSISKENFRFVFVEKQHTIKDLGEATVCRGDSVKMGSRYVRQPGFHYDTVAGEMAKADTVYQLYLHVNPTYHDTLHFLVERDSMPYILGKDTIRNFGWTRLNALTVNGCDSVIYVQLDTLYVHRERHFYDTLQACGEAVLSWRGREITQTGEYADTVVDPYRGGTDSIYHLRADIYPTYQETLHFSTEPDSMPYIYGKDTIRNFGLTELHRYQTVNGCDSIIYVRLDTLYIHRERHFYDTLDACGEVVLSWRGREITQTGEYADTVVDPYRGGTDSIYHLRADIYPTYQETLHFSTEPDSMPYIYGKDTIRNFGLTELHRYQTVHGCDSIIYVRLDTLYIHRERHFYDTLRACGETVLSWRGREITQTGEYADTVIDPYKGGTDSIHHLRADIYPTYHETYTDSCYIEQLPYTVGGRPMQDFGEQTERYVTVAGCDSLREYSLSRRWRHYRVRVEVKGEGSVNVTDTVLREDGTLWLAFLASACHRLDSLRIDGRNVPPQSRYLLQDLHGDCTVEAVFGVAAPTESVLRREACRDSLPIIYNGETYGEGEHTIVLRSAAGCDSVVRLYVQGKENAARLAVTDTIAPPCNTSEIAFSYRTEAGSPRQLRLAFDPVAEKAGFRDTVLAVSSTGKQTVRIALPPSAHPDRYGLRLWQTDISGCYAAVDDLAFEIPYPSTIIVQKWSDVLAVLSAEYNGGYEFSGYQWYKNGEAIEGATRPYYQAKPYLRSTDTYAVLLERASDGLRLQSCGVKRKSYPKELVLELLPNPTASGEAVTVRVNGKPDAEGIIEVFDGIGKPVYERPFRESHILPAHWQPGTYVVRVRNAKSTWMATGKLIVR